MVTTKKVAPVKDEPVKKPARSKATAAPKVPSDNPAATKPASRKRTATPATQATGSPSSPAKKGAVVVPVKVVAPKKEAARTNKPMDPARRANYVEVAAFYIAERRGFASARPMDDWLEAEAEIDRLIASGHFGN